MGSPTRKLKVRRALSKANQAKKRKNHVRSYGSTTKNLVLNMPNANEKQVATN